MRNNDCRTTMGRTGFRSGVRRRRIRERLGAICAVPALAIVVTTLVVTAFGTSTAAGAQTCANGTYPTGNPAYQVRIADDPTGSACLTIGTTDSSFTVNSTSNPSPTSDALRYTGFYSAYTG